MSRNLVLGLLLMGALVAGALATSSAGAAEEGLTVGVSPGAGGAVFEVEGASRGEIVVTLSGPHGVTRHAFKAGETPLVDLSASPDGTYAWELSARPLLDRETRARLAAARDAADRDAVERQLRAEGKLPPPLVASGYLTVAGGAMLAADLQEPGAAAPATGGARATGSTNRAGAGPRNVTALDQVIPDDLIVQGSACVGLDCVNNENFGFDTIRLKENNLRIKFEDTSTTAGFPTTDWQLTANDSASGGASKFSIDEIDGARTPFTIRAGAPSNSLFVDSAGRMGIGTATPVLNLHIATGNTPSLRLEQNGSSGFAPQTWDIAGNEANFFVRDVTGGSRLPLRIRPGAPTSSLDINASGNIGINTAAPEDRLHVNDGNILIKKTGNTADTQIGFQIESAGGTVSKTWFVRNNPANGAFTVSTVSTGVAPLKIFPDTEVNTLVLINNASQGRVGIGTVSPAGKLDVNGTIFQRGVQIHADYVFEPDYELESIEDHAAYMWVNKHLPGIGKAQVDEEGREVVELGQRQRGVLEELEKAHIYIEQLHGDVRQLSEAVRQKDAALAELTARLEKLEAAGRER